VLVLEETLAELLLLETCRTTDDPATLVDRLRLLSELAASLLEITADELDPLATLATLLVIPLDVIFVVR